ncbi:thiamine pyrophosphate-dependent enzyme [Pontibacterium granulatum]|uniref:dehydrogenase E1 component subunit alpha/beta n=1 Tax=Pontibacterium granulatum TaxID=2036029 RepID=UPI002499B722|nr:alpha-ketoacid dehydrogenase subunit alpha/beta [Pontibacterium granulatum]MDI3324079.1 thiamine pyrophosphate-dependent enzyme [Pontibacterium granulatum]
MQNRAEVIDQNFVKRVLKGDLPVLTSRQDLNPSGLDQDALVQLFESQLLSRHLDLCSRKLQARGESFYTIGSAGHEGNAAIAAAFRQDDMAFLHYRDAAFLIQRARQTRGQDPVWDMLLSFTTSSEDPISGGRHKVLGSKSLYVPPQTSTVASHLPKALGTAYSIPLAKRLDLASTLPYDSVVICSFGDASANHSTAQGAFNAACWAAFHKVPLPLVFICEDNGIGISTPTPSDWIETTFRNKPGLHYLQCNGLNLLDTYQAACEAERLARCHHQPVFLHVRCIRLLGHAGSDAEIAYRSQEQIEATEAQDPLLYSARLLIDNAVLSPVQIVSLYQAAAAEVAETAERAIQQPKLGSVEEVMRSLIPPRRSRSTSVPRTAQQSHPLFEHEQKSIHEPQHMARLINWALTDLMARYPEIIMMGEDIGPKGGVYNVTGQLSKKFGNHRVINTLLDEQSILGLAIGSAHNGFLPIPEIQFLAYVHNAEDQIRGEAATLSFFSNGQFTNPMVIRIAGLGYQKGFGGHFHNDNSLNVFRDIPGVIVACPSNGQDAVEMLRECVRLAHEEQRVVVFIEPIALYMTRDLHEPNDGLWTFKYQPIENSSPIPLGRLGHHGDGTELAILSYGNGYYLSRQAAQILEQVHGISLRVIDLRWLAPLNETEIITAVRGCDRLLIVDECRRTGSLSEQLVTLIHEELDNPPPMKRICAEDSFIALGRAATATLPSKERIISTALDFLTPDHLSD